MLDMPAGDQDIRNAERKRSVSFKVPSGVAGLIVGKKGVNIKKFKQQAGVKIALPYGEGAEKTAPLKTVVIEGAAPKVDAGIAMLCEILSAWAEKDETGTAEHQGVEAWEKAIRSSMQEDAGTRQPPANPTKDKKQANQKAPDSHGVAKEDSVAAGKGGVAARGKDAAAQVRLVVVIPCAGAGMIVGKEGKTIKGINHKTGALAALAKAPLEDNPSRKELIITGTRAQVHKAKDELLTVMLQWLRNAPDEPGGGPSATKQTLLGMIEEREEEVAAAAAANGVPAEGKGKSGRGKDTAAQGEDAGSGDAGGVRGRGGRGQGGADKVVAARGLELISDTSDGVKRRVEMFVTIAAAAMIIGKKGSMLKQLQAKSSAAISLDQMQQADGTKRVCIEGVTTAVDIAFREIQEMVNLCDDAKYEEVTKQRQREETSKKAQEEEAARKLKQEKQAMELARQAAAKRAAEEEARRVAEEKKWMEKKEKALREAEEKKKLQAKIAANPFAFLDQGDKSSEEEEEEEDEATSKRPSSAEKKKKKKGKSGKGGASGGQSPEEARGPGGNSQSGGAQDERIRRQSNVSVRSLESRADASSDDDSALDMIGLDRLLQMQELKPEEQCNSFSLAMDQSSPLEVKKRLEVQYHSTTRRGIAHANEDRVNCLNLASIMSQEAVTNLLEGSESTEIPLFLVLDGHGGAGVAAAAQQALPRKVAEALERLMQEAAAVGAAARELVPKAMELGFEDMEETSVQMFDNGKGDPSGACAVCVVLTDTEGEYRMDVANLGDCRAVVARLDGNKYTSVPLTKDHRATVQAERSRIEAVGGQVKDKRALGDLIPSRTLGDIKTKNKCPGAVIAVPEFSRHELQYKADNVMVLATDGLWDELKNAKVMDLLHKHPHSAKSACDAINQAVLKKCAGGERKPNDDLSVVVVSFAWR
eukprot:Tamp_03908.p1 GENE.Tamp_03908~~Tamp_03908.p1  ORF type:complete len:930 (+),score=316.91 Tamp_03908:693-3482(+)